MRHQPGHGQNSSPNATPSACTSGTCSPGSNARYEIVGADQDVRDHGLRGNIPRRFYVPVAHALPEVPPSVNFEIRTAADSGSVVFAVRGTIREADRSIPILSVDTIDDLVGRRLVQERLVAEPLDLFRGAGSAAGVGGVYCVLSYAPSGAPALARLVSSRPYE